MKILTILHMIAASVVALILSGCETDQKDLKAELRQLSGNLPQKIEPLPVVKPYLPFPYEDNALRDPFNPALAVSAAPTAGKNGLQPDMHRTQDVLETFTLDSIKMVGTLSQNGVITALVKADGNLFKITTGRYMGQNYGRVANVTKSAIDIKELVQDDANNWNERITILKLQDYEGKK